MSENRKVNLCSTYILPLLGLNRQSFGELNFVNSYLNEDGSHVVVELKLITQFVRQHNRFRFDFKSGEHNYAVLEMLSEYLETVQLFIQGKYSQFPIQAKNLIKTKSGLRNGIPNPKGGYTSARDLLVLDKHPELRRALEEELSNPGSPVKIDFNAELQDIPGDDNFFRLGLAHSMELTV